MNFNDLCTPDTKACSWLNIYTNSVTTNILEAGTITSDLQIFGKMVGTGKVQNTDTTPLTLQPIDIVNGVIGFTNIVHETFCTFPSAADVESYLNLPSSVQNYNFQTFISWKTNAGVTITLGSGMLSYDGSDPIILGIDVIPQQKVFTFSHSSSGWRVWF